MSDDLVQMTPELLRELIDYDPDTGALTWKTRRPEHFRRCKVHSPEHECNRWNARHAGTPALNVSVRNYRRGWIMGHRVAAHRAAFSIFYGRHPEGHIDHINGDPSDNRIANLRDVDAEGNARNARLRTDNSTGIPGVSYHGGRKKWVAYIGLKGGQKHLGIFDTRGEAVAVRQAAEAEAGYHKNHGRA